MAHDRSTRRGVNTWDNGLQETAQSIEDVDSQVPAVYGERRSVLQRGAQGGGEAGMMGLSPRLHLLLAAATEGTASPGHAAFPPTSGPHPALARGSPPRRLRAGSPALKRVSAGPRPFVKTVRQTSTSGCDM